MKIIWFIFGIVIIVLLFAARKESGRHQDKDIQEIDQGHLVYKRSTGDNTKDGVRNIVIVIPYRDRVVHYKKIMEHLPSITRENWRMHIILVEQFDKKPFRRAWLINIGIAEAKKRIGGDKTCIVTHDVDMIADSKVDYGWCDRPTQICSELSCFNGGVHYTASGGGVVQALLKDWYTINGFTNTAIGWGGEDDDLHHRFRVNHLLTRNHLRRPKKGFGKCHCMHDTDHTKRVKDPKGYKDILSKIGRMTHGSDEWKTDGLNSLKYHVSEESVDKYGTVHLKVNDEVLDKWAETKFKPTKFKPNNYPTNFWSLSQDVKDQHVPKNIKSQNDLKSTILDKDVCINKPSGAMWNTFMSMVNVLNNLNANYTISSGTVLSWYRDCSLGSSDIDVDINLDWFTKKQHRLHEALIASGWRQEGTFGTFGDVGYEEAWKKNNIKTDLFSLAYVDGRYIQGLTVKGKVYPCDSFLERYETHTWNNVSFQVPAPIEPYLRGLYGNWRKKHIQNYVWDVEPFKTDNGRSNCYRDVEEMKKLQLKYKNNIVVEKANKLLLCCQPDQVRCEWITKGGIIPSCEKENLISLLKWFKNVLGDDIVWYITHGTLLGATRNESHIPHETDIDVAIITKHLKLAHELIEKHIGETHFIYNKKTVPIRLFFSQKNKVHVDIWPVIRKKDTSKEIQPIKNNGLFWYDVNSTWLFPLKKCKYEGILYPCPRENELWTRTRYGSDWVDQRQNIQKDQNTVTEMVRGLPV